MVYNYYDYESDFEGYSASYRFPHYFSCRITDLMPFEGTFSLVWCRIGLDMSD